MRPRCTPAPVLTLVVKTIAEFDIDFARIVPVEAAEGDAVVEFDAAAGNVDRVHRSGNYRSTGEELSPGRGMSDRHGTISSSQLSVNSLSQLQQTDQSEGANCDQILGRW